MKILRVLGIIFVLLAAVGLLYSVRAESSYRSRAVLGQRVQTSKGSDLFGGDPTPIGSPQKFIIDDPKAFLPASKEGVKQIDENYLIAQNIYPLQLVTVQVTISLIRLILGGTFILGALLIFIASRVIKNRRLAA